MASQTALSRYGGWVPKSRSVYKAFIDEHVKLAKARIEANQPHEQAVADFQEVIQSDPEMLSLMDNIFRQVSSENQIPDFEHLLSVMDSIIVTAPRFHVTPERESEPIGVPLYLIFDLLCNTDAAHDLFRMPAFNVAMKNVLDAWSQYLTSPESISSLTDEPEGWFGTEGLKLLEEGRGEFNDTYVTPDPNAVNRGYTSWDEFFTREIQADARPILESQNKSLIHNACESTVYRISHNVKAHDQFWLKGQSYSLWDMFNIEPDRESYVQKFVGGTVYQAFLGPQDYHRWRSPVDGTIIKTVVVPGTYYATLPDAGAEPGDPDLAEGDPHGSLLRSQAWLSMHATRAIIFIEADNPDIGLMCFIGVGMVEVSTCIISVEESQKVQTGDQLGMFRFGGSTHALLFGPQANITFADHVIPDTHILVNSILAQVSPAN